MVSGPITVRLAVEACRKAFDNMSSPGTFKACILVDGIR
jgi:hypothetical protein